MIIYFTLQLRKSFRKSINSAQNLFSKTVSPEKASNKSTFVTINLKMEIMELMEKIKTFKVLEKLNQLAGKNGIGRVDLVENRFLGIKSEEFTKLQEEHY